MRSEREIERMLERAVKVKETGTSERNHAQAEGLKEALEWVLEWLADDEVAAAEA